MQIFITDQIVVPPRLVRKAQEVPVPQPQPSRMRLTESRYQQLVRVEEAYKEAAQMLMELRTYLSSDKFHQDTTVQVKDVFARLPNMPTEV